MSFISEIIAEQVNAETFRKLGNPSLCHCKDSLIFNSPASSICKSITIILEPSDTYTMKFQLLNGKVETINDVYCDDLHDRIEEQTGINVTDGRTLFVSKEVNGVFFFDTEENIEKFLKTMQSNKDFIS